MPYADLTFQVQPGLRFVPNDFVNLFGTPPTTTSTTTTLNIISSGLILDLDASNTSSYPGTGTLWTDLSGNGYNATKQGTIPFTSAGQQSYFGFSGSTSNYFLGNNNLYGTNSNQISGTVGITIQLVIKPTSISSRSFIFSNYTSGVGGYDFEIGSLGGLWTNTLRNYLNSQASPSASSDNRGTSSVLSNGTIYLVTFTWDQSSKTANLYLNSTLIPQDHGGFNSSAITYAWANQSNYTIGSDTSNGGTYGNIYTAYVYNRPLTAGEVTQNYNALQSRFGL